MCDATATALCSPPSNNHKSMIILCEKFLPHIILLYHGMIFILFHGKHVGCNERWWNACYFYNNLDLFLKKSGSLRTLTLSLCTLSRSPSRDYFSGTNENKHIAYSSKQNSSLYLPRNTNIGYHILWYYFLLFLLQSLFPELLNFSGCIFR